MPQPTSEFLSLQAALAGRYSIEREIGRGGMGIVFLARDVALSRPVAIKLLPSHLAQQPEMRERFLREAQTAAGLFHPNIVPIYLVEEHDDLVFFVMAFVEGETVGERVRRSGPMGGATVARMMEEVAWALGYAHEKGIIHRDIKPDNVLFERSSGRFLVADFGIARIAETSSGAARGELLGTLQYMSPEQATAEPLDGRSDLYSLGVSAFYAVAGRLPFESTSAAGMIHQHVTQPAPPVASLGTAVPPALAETIDRCLAKRPGDRFESGEALARAVGMWRTATPAVPPEIRLLLRRIRNANAMLGLTVGASILSAMFLASPVLQMIGMAPVPVRVGMIAIPSLLALRGVYRLMRDARRALRRGFGIGYVREALSAEASAMLEEGASQAPLGMARSAAYAGPALPEVHKRWENPSLSAGRRREQIIAGRWVALALSGYVPVGLYVGAPFQTISFGAFMFLSFVFATAAGPRVGNDSPLVTLDWGERLLIGRFGRLLFRVAAIRQAGPINAVVMAGERTEIALALAVDELFETLPAAMRSQLGDVRPMIRQMERHAGSLREREEALSGAMANVEFVRGPAELEGQHALRIELDAERRAVRERLKTTVAALENIRLDLIRVSAGVGSSDNLTADLEQARQLSIAVDAELAGRREVDELLRSKPRP